jgi:hypothetical protein
MRGIVNRLRLFILYSDSTIYQLNNIFNQTNSIPNETTALKQVSSKQQIIQHFKLNYGLFLNEYSIETSKQAIYSEDRE